MTAASNDPAPQNPFEKQAFREPSLLKSIFGGGSKTDAQAALETRLAEHGLSSVTPAFAIVFLKGFGLVGPSAQAVLVDIWKRALGKFIADDEIIDDAEAAFLVTLQKSLGLSDQDVETIRDSVVSAEFLKRATRILASEGAVTQPETITLMEFEAGKLRVSADRHRQLVADVAQAALTSELQFIAVRRRISNPEVDALLAFEKYYCLTMSAEDSRKWVRCWTLWLLDQNAELPALNLDIALLPNENCVAGILASLWEIRKVRQQHMSRDEWKQIDNGLVYLTTERILFVGRAATKAVQYESIIAVSADKNVLAVQKLSGKNQSFQFGDDLDREVAQGVIERMRLCGNKEVAAEHAPSPATPALPAQPVAVKPASAYSEQRQKPEPANLDSLLSELDCLIGLGPVKRDVRSLVNFLRVQRLRRERGLPAGQLTLHLVFTGNPGTGKTTVARILANMYTAMGFLLNGHLTEVDKSGLVGGYLGQTAIKTAQVIEKALGGVLFIDEAYALARSPKGTEWDMYGTEAIDTLIKAMEDHRDQLVVIVAGYREPMEQFLNSNPGLRSRFTRYIDFPDYSPEELMQILDAMAKDAGYSLSDAARSRARATLTDAYATRGNTFGNGRFVRTLFERACVCLADRLEQDSNITDEDLTIIQEQDVQSSAAVLTPDAKPA